MLLGAARYLTETRNFDGTVYLIFQPAEEGLGGGRLMVEEGLFERCPMEMVFGMHNWPQLPAGIFGWRDGPIMAGAAALEITINGRGSHAAFPHLGIDPILIATQIVGALQTIVTRTIDPAECSVISIGQIVGGDTFNVIPDSVLMRGTARWFDEGVGDQIEDGVHRLVTGITESFRAKSKVDYRRVMPATINDGGATTIARRAALAVADEMHVTPLRHPNMGAEDFAFMLEAKPGSYILLGAGRDDGGPMLHEPRYDFNDEILPIGASYWAKLVEQSLPKSV
jgi:hippurate hydrolase